MSHFGLICPPIAGHVNPLAALGRALIRRGHQVSFVHVGDLEQKALAEGLGFIALGDGDYARGELARSVEQLSKLSGIASLKFAVACACRISNLILRYGPEAMRSARIDALLVDQNEPAGGTVAEHLGIPFVTVCTSLPLNREPLIPPPFVGWQYHDSVFAGWRNGLGYAISDRLIAPIQAVLNQYRNRWRLPALRKPDDSFSPLAQLAQMPREFDFPRKKLPGTFQYLGPWFDDASASFPFPFEELDGRPLVYGSLGTLQDKGSRYFEIMAEAAARVDVQLVVALGAAAGRYLGSLPGKPVVVNYAPQIQLLARASAVITHSGMNTTQQALSFGVPMVAIPLTHDQPAIASRLARTGAGIVLPPNKLSAQRLRAALEPILSEQSECRTQARRLQNAIRAAGGVTRGAEIAEQAAKLQPVSLK